MVNVGKNSFKVLFLILINTFFINLFFPAYSAELSKCEININKYFAVNEYFDLKQDILKDTTNQTIDSLNVLYYNFIAKPNASNNIKDTYLFRPLEYDNIDKNEFSVVSFKKNDQIICNLNKITNCMATANDTEYNEKEKVFTEITDKTFPVCSSGNSVCLDDTTGSIVCSSSCSGGRKKLNCSSTDCVFDGGNLNFTIKIVATNYLVSQKKNCFPTNHICQFFKKDMDLYFSIDQFYFDSSKEKNKIYYVYEKNPLLSNNKNCVLSLFKCDFKIKNESVISNEKNVVYVNTTDAINRTFIENINAGLGKMAFFKFIGSCNKSTEECKKILSEYSYYKYMNKTTNIVYYFEKNFVNQKGLICDGYLPNCKDMNLKVALYDDTIGNSIDNNENARKTFYINQDVNHLNVRDENLWFVNSNNFANTTCLNVNGNTNSPNYKGYCSDLNETMTGLVYPNGFDITTKNCYFKSCKDLTPEEIKIINNNGNGKKFCSEYVWLTNNFGFKYFPKDKLVFCSDIENNKLKFPQGFEAENPKCYLKNCFSLESEKERELILKNNYEDFLDKISWSYDIQGKGNGEEHLITEYYKIRKYCFKGLFFTKDNLLYSKLNFINFNINACNDFNEKQLNEIKNKNFVPLFSKFFENNDYDSYSNSYFCRTHIAPYNREIEGIGATFLRNTLIGLDERKTENISSSYIDMFNLLYGYDINDFPKSSYNALKIKEMDNYGKLVSNKIDDAELINNNNFGNYCNYVDNLFLYRDTAIGELNPISNSKTGAIVTFPSIPNNKIRNESNVIDTNISYYDVLTNNILFKAENYNNCIKVCPNIEKDDKDCTACDSKNTNEEKKKCFEDNKNCLGNLCFINCKINNQNEEKYYDIQNIIFNNLINCETYNSTPRKKTDYSFFDCDLFVNDADILNSKIIPYLTKLQPIANVKDQEYFKNLLKESCRAEYFIEEEKNNVVLGSYISSLVRPYITPNIKYTTFDSYRDKFNSVGELILNSQSKARAGCSIYQKLFSEGLLQPKDYSIFFDYEKNDLIKTLNNPSKNKSVNAEFNYKIPLCFRGSFPGLNIDTCGLREGYNSKDKCIEVTTGNKIDFNGFFSSDSSSLTESYYSSWDSGRDIYYIQRIKTDRGTFSTNNPNYFDKEAYHQVTLECLIVSIPVGVLTTSICVAVSSVFSFLCPAVGAAAGLAAQNICVSARSKEYNFEFEGGLSSPYEYLKNEDDTLGFLSPITLVNNDNYYYNYYPRSVKIEEDIKNQISYNKESNTSKRFFHRTTKSFDIIRHCGISDMLVDENNCLTNKNAICSFKIRKYKNDASSSHDGFCQEIVGGDYSKCLSDKQKNCLKSFGVEFLNFSNLVINNFMNSNIFIPYQDGTKMTWFKNRNNNNRNISELPVNIISLAKYNGTEENLINNRNCLLDNYGDPITDLSKCRVIDYDNFLATESQSLKKPLLTSPPYFFKTATPSNIPEIFLPAFFLKRFKDYADYLKNVADTREITTSFFTPKLHFVYEFLANNDPDRVNILGDVSETDVSHFVNKQNHYSSPFVVKYKPNNPNIGIPELEMRFIIEKKYEGDSSIYSPTVCVHKIAIVGNTLNPCLQELNNSSATNGTTKSYTPIIPCSDRWCLNYPTISQCPVNIYNQYFCYNRQMPSLKTNFVFKQDEGIDYLFPVINAYIKPEELTKFEDFNKMSYVFIDYKISTGLSNTTEVKSYRINQISKEAINEIQGALLTFERSFCSMAIYDYYKYIDSLLREKNKETNEQDPSSMNKYQDKINTIESFVIPECKRLNGNVNEILENDNSLFPIRDSNDITKVFYKEIKKLKENNIIYGGFNEICVEEKVIKNFDKERRYYNEQLLEDVVVFKNKESTNMDMTKCMLDGFSLSKKECLEDDKVYVYCEAGSANCIKKFNITKNIFEYVMSIDCEDLRKKIINNAEIIIFNIENIQACYKGGFNSNKTVYKKDGSGPEYSCSCTLRKNVSELNSSIFSVRKITARELGLCVNLEDVSLCPAVKYFDSNGNYVDDNLALGKTYEELTTPAIGETSYEKKLRESKYEQHLWRTTETLFGTIPSVFFSHILGNAEFDTSNYCGADDNTMTKEDLNTRCLGGNSIIYGECRGYWKENNFLRPRAVCGKYEYNGKTIYEYKLIDNPCVRYQCNSLGFYDDDKKIAFDEKDILNKTSELFIAEEIDTFKKNVTIKDFNIIFNDEESELYKVDKRGASNGFASWYKKISSDFAQKVVSSQCLTGFLPASGNYVVNNAFDSYNGNEYIDYNVILNSSLQSQKLTVFNQIISLQEEKKNIFENITENLKSYLPFRYCDQKGNWLIVQDLYNKDTYLLPENVRYFHKNNNSWINTSLTSPGFTTLSSSNKYCERLFCKKINSEYINNANVYKNEFLNFGEDRTKEKARVWKHSGGSLWDAIGASRNSSGVLNTTALFDRVNTNLNYIFQQKDDKSIRSEYRYLKRVEGLCYTPYGYYDRGTEFDGKNNFNSQTVIINSLMSGIIKPQNYTITIDSVDGIDKPERTCDSNGLWGGIQNNCFRVCEMLDIYRTSILNEKVSMNVDKNVKIENHEILNTKVNGYNISTEENERENKFQLYGLATNEKFKNLNSVSGGGFYYGDYITGGASWGRVIVPKKTINRDSTYGGLRYVEVEGICDSSYIRKDNDVRQYTYATDNSGKQIKPKRKCYEDGTWGPVYENTLCGLAKTCVQFNFSIKNLVQLNDSFNNNESLLLMNNVLAKIISYDSTRNNPQNCPNSSLLSNPNNINNCVFGNLEASNATLRSVLSENNIQFTNNYLFTTQNLFVCNQSNITGDYQPGWNLKDRDIGKYFIPATCLPSNVNNYHSNIEIKRNRGESYPLGLSYSRETNLEFMYKDQSVKYFPNTQVLSVPIRDRRERNINIGSKNYNSFQITTQCLSSVFYNTMAGKGNNDDYVVKDIILECKMEASSNNSNFNYPDEILSSSSKKTLLEPKFITFDECKPKTCGGNDSYQVNAGHSYVNTYNQSTYGDYPFGAIPTTSQSYIECPAGSSFIVDTNDYNKANVDFSNGDIGKNFHFIQRFKNINCNQNKKNFGKINGTNVGINTYGYNKHGELEFSGIPTRFCTNIEKGSFCKNLTEDYIMNNPEFKTKYCVVIGCKKYGLNFNSDPSKPEINSSTNGTGFTTGNGVGVSPFDEYHVLYSLDKDYSEGINLGMIKISGSCKDPNICDKITAKTKVGDGSPNDGKVCPAGQDIYNEGSTKFSYFDNFFNKFLSSEKTTVSSCFQNLNSFDDSLSYSYNGNCGDSKKRTHNGKEICITYSAEFTIEYETKKNLKQAAIEQYNFATGVGSIIFANKSKEYIIKNMIDPFFDFGDSINIWNSKMLTKFTEVSNNLKNTANTFVINSFSSLPGDVNEQGLVVFQNKWADNSEAIQFISVPNTEIGTINNPGLTRYLELNNPQNPKIYKSTTNNVTTYYIKFSEITKTVIGEEVKGERLLVTDAYEVAFILKYVPDREVEKTNIKNTLQSNSDYKDVYDYYVSIFSMEDFINKENNVEYYNLYYSNLLGKSFQATKEDGVEKTSFLLNIDTGNTLEQRILILNPIDRTIDCKISKGEEENQEEITCIATQSEKTSILSDFDIYYKNFLSVEKNNIFVINESICLSYYTKYLDDEIAFESTQTSKFKNGFFMAMKCTPEGWQVVDKPNCKKRCSSSREINVDPDGVGDYYIKINISNLRHTGSTGMIEVGAKRSLASCSKHGGSLGIYRVNGANFSCNDGNMSIYQLDNGGGVSKYFSYHGDWRVWKINCNGGLFSFGIWRDTGRWKDASSKQAFVMCPWGIVSQNIDCGYIVYPTTVSYSIR